jgi:transcriptional regulator with XRE-family HTH domain
MSDARRRRELGAFLRAHRELIRPAQVGMPATPRRRTPGLRREEVAAMAGVGLAWYSWLEQGRVSASRQVLDAVARALRLDDGAWRHVMTLAGLQPLEAPDRSGRLAEAMGPMLALWTTHPAALLDRHLDLISWNAAFSAVWCEPAAAPETRRNLLCMLAGNRMLSMAIPEWESITRALAQQFRAQADRHPDARSEAIFAALHQARPDLAPWWRCRSVGEFGVRTATVGDVRLVLSLLRAAEDPDCLLLLQTPVGGVDHQRIAELMDDQARRAG